MPDWITAIDDDVALTDLAIPGTHDSASWTHEEGSGLTFTWAQRLNFTGQLDIGVRAFDLRIGWKHWYGSKDIAMFHGPRQVNDQTLDDVLAEIKTWLDQHQGEFVILMFQQQGIKGNQSDCRVETAKLVKKYFSGTRFFSYSPHHISWPTVGRLRNRVIVMERLQSREAGWYNVSAWSDAPAGQLMEVPKHLYIYLQDKYKNVSDAYFYNNTILYEAKKKMEFVEATARATLIVDNGRVLSLGHSRRVLKINHTSYSNKLNDPYELGEVFNALLRTKTFRIQGIMMIDDADQATVDHILQYNPT